LRAALGRVAMKRSVGRILTTHTGSLPRPADLLAMIEAREAGREVDGEVFAARLASGRLWN
jgi:5-methyltetrahydropteroyltriglutamate--homocysteine methyltransferase